jgi:hypothetical protein
MTEITTKPQLERPAPRQIDLDGLTDSQCEAMRKLVSLLRALYTSDAKQELDEFWTAWSEMVPTVPRAEVEPLIERAVAARRQGGDAMKRHLRARVCAESLSTKMSADFPIVRTTDGQ